MIERASVRGLSGLPVVLSFGAAPLGDGRDEPPLSGGRNLNPKGCQATTLTQLCIFLKMIGSDGGITASLLPLDHWRE